MNEHAIWDAAVAADDDNKDDYKVESANSKLGKFNSKFWVKRAEIYVIF